MKSVLTAPSLLFFAFVLPGCSPPNPPIAELPPTTVSVVTPVKMVVQDEKQFLATLAPAESIEVRARVTGYLTEVKFKSGQKVEKDKTELFVIDRRPFEAALKKAEGEVEIARANLKLAESDLARTDVALKANAGSVSAADRDKSKAQVDVSKAQLDANNAARDQAKINLDFTVIKADVNGRIDRNLITVGNLVSADQTLLTKIVKPDPIDAYFDVDELTVQRYKQNEDRANPERVTDVPVVLGLQQNGDALPYKGKVDFANPWLNPKTGTLQVRAEFWEKDQAGQKDPLDPRRPLTWLEPGYSARVQVAVGPPTEQILIPDRAVGTDQGQRFVYVVNSENIVEYRKVTLGNLYRVKIGNETGDMRAIENGLDGNESIIVNGLQFVRRGAKVVPEAVDPLTERNLKQATPKAKK